MCVCGGVVGGERPTPLLAPASSQTGTAGREPAEVAGGVRRTISNNCFLIAGGVRG